MVFSASPNLEAINLTDEATSDTVQWSFSGDKELSTASYRRQR